MDPEEVFAGSRLRMERECVYAVTCAARDLAEDLEWTEPDLLCFGCGEEHARPVLADGRRDCRAFFAPPTAWREVPGPRSSRNTY